MTFCQLWQALGRSVRRSAVCHVTYPANSRQNARQNALQWPCGTPWGLVGRVTVCHGACHAPTCPARLSEPARPVCARALCAGQPFDGTRQTPRANPAGASSVR
jgi:hypothetical protein